MQTNFSTLELQASQEFKFPEISFVSCEHIMAYLHRSQKIAEIRLLAERELQILAICNQMNVTVSEEELQAAGDSFRIQNKLFEANETINWLSKQRITIDEWSEGLRVRLLAKKLKELLFGNLVDDRYLNNRHKYQRIALSQIIVQHLDEAEKIIKMLQKQHASFCNLALEYSQEKNAQANGGFTGIHFIIQLMPGIKQAIANSQEGEIVGPVSTKIGYHILKVEKRFPIQLSESMREEIIELIFQNWLQKSSRI